MIPSWDNAPKWANWLAQDRDGYWMWYEKKPEKSNKLEMFVTGGNCMTASIDNPDWRNTLQYRPLTPPQK
jgi:hypothetical protein